jgi:hypothetical protein
VTRKFIQAVFISFLSTTVLMGAQAQRWIHVQVQNVKGVSGNVSVNLPIEMASAALSSIPTEHHQGKFHIEGSVNGTDLRAVLNAVRSSPDNVFVTLDRRDKVISVAKSGRSLLIRIADKPDFTRQFDKRVAIKVPVSVVRAMLGNNSEEIDIGAGIRALTREGEVDVTMNNEQQSVRVWTDTRTTSD